MPVPHNRPETLEYIKSRARLVGIPESSLHLDTERPDKLYWDIYIIFGGSEDEHITLGDTVHAVTITEWLAEQCAIEATVNATCNDTELEEWVVELYPSARFEGDSPVHVMRSSPDGWILCSWGCGGDPASGCDAPVTGHDRLCDAHRRAARDMERAVPEAG